MARYYRSDLRFDVAAINKRAEDAGVDSYLRVEGRNGYTALDEHDRKTGKCFRNIECGTPKECLAAAITWASA